MEGTGGTTNRGRELQERQGDYRRQGTAGGGKGDRGEPSAIVH